MLKKLRNNKNHKLIIKKFQMIVLNLNNNNMKKLKLEFFKIKHFKEINKN